MRIQYKFHPPVYALGETEKFYSDMEARGWRLQKRGGSLSKFTRTEPSQARYRVEIVVPTVLDLPDGMPEDQLAVYEDCGWDYVTDQGPVYIFRAPAGSDAPEFYSDPRQQAEVLKKWKRRDRWGWAVAVLFLSFWGLIGWSLGGTWEEAWTELRRGFVEYTAAFLLYLSILLGALTEGIYGSWKFGRLYRRLKKGLPMDHAPRGRGYRIPAWLFRTLTVLFLLLTAVQWLGSRTYDLPRTADGPYVLLEDLGYTGERTENWVNHNPSQVCRSRSLLAERWDVGEFLSGQDGKDAQQIWMYQDVYRLSPLVEAEAFARILMDDSVMARGAERYTEIPAEGLDRAWMVEGGLEAVAVRGRYVFYLQHLSPDRDGQNDVFAAIFRTIASLDPA